MVILEKYPNTFKTKIRNSHFFCKVQHGIQFKSSRHHNHALLSLIAIKKITKILKSAIKYTCFKEDGNHSIAESHGLD